MGRSDDIASVLIGVLGGVALVSILKKLSERPCNQCKNVNEFNATNCKFCGGRLQWP